jgi:hypothetical protein
MVAREFPRVRLVRNSRNLGYGAASNFALRVTTGHYVLVANADVVNYWGIVAPAGTPRDIVVRLNAETLRILAQPDLRERLEKEGAELIPGPPEKLGALIEADLAGWKKLIAEANLQLE